MGDARLVASVRRPSLTDNVNSVAVLTVPSSSLIWHNRHTSRFGK